MFVRRNHISSYQVRDWRNIDFNGFIEECVLTVDLFKRSVATFVIVTRHIVIRNSVKVRSIWIRGHASILGEVELKFCSWSPVRYHEQEDRSIHIVRDEDCGTVSIALAYIQSRKVRHCFHYERFVRNLSKTLFCPVDRIRKYDIVVPYLSYRRRTVTVVAHRPFHCHRLTCLSV